MEKQEKSKPNTRMWAELLDPQSISDIWNWMVDNIEEMRDMYKLYPLNGYNVCRVFDGAWDFFISVDWEAGFYGDNDYFVLDESGMYHSIEEIDPDDYEIFLRIASDPDNYEALVQLQREVGGLRLEEIE